MIAAERARMTQRKKKCPKIEIEDIAPDHGHVIGIGNYVLDSNAQFLTSILKSVI